MPEFLLNLLSPFLLNLFVAIGIGLIVGMEREFDIVSGREHFAGIRAFTFMSLLGCIVTFLSVKYNPYIILVVVPTIFIYISVFHYSKIKQENFGIVTELSLVLVFFLGVLTGLNYIKEALAVAVIVTVLLTLKKQFRNTLKHITQEELYAFVKFIVLALLLLPFLPDAHYGPGGIINPSSIGYIIVIVSLLNFISYFIMKFFGTEKEIFFTSFFGGIFSSTAVTWAFSKRSKENPSLSYQYAGGIIIACTVMLLRVLIISLIFNLNVFLWLLVPCITAFAVSVLVIFFIKKNLKQDVKLHSLQLGNPLNVVNAFLFGLIYIFVTLVVYYANHYIGLKGLAVTGTISGLADLDATNISISKLSASEIKPAFAAIIIMLAMLSNTFLKILIAFLFGSSELRRKVTIGLLPAITVIALAVIGIYIFY